MNGHVLEYSNDGVGKTLMLSTQALMFQQTEYSLILMLVASCEIARLELMMEQQ